MTTELDLFSGPLATPEPLPPGWMLDPLGNLIRKTPRKETIVATISEGCSGWGFAPWGGARVDGFLSREAAIRKAMEGVS